MVMGLQTNKYIYSAMLRKAYDMGIVPNKTRDARDWFRAKALNYRAGRIAENRPKLFQGAITTKNITPGRMYMFVYDAKWKDELPFWDAFPMIFVVAIDANYFYGINLHYLAPALRARLMDALYLISNNTKYDDSTKIMLSYKILKNTSNLTYFKPCFKMYLRDHVKSNFIYIPPSEWDIALMLPTQKFQKASTTEVWRASTEMINNKKPTKAKTKKQKV